MGKDIPQSFSCRSSSLIMAFGWRLTSSSFLIIWRSSAIRLWNGSRSLSLYIPDSFIWSRICYMGSQASDPYYQVRTGCEVMERDLPGGGPTHPHGCDLGISRWTFSGLPDGHEEKRKQVEYVCHRCVQPVVIRLLVISDFVQPRDCTTEIRGWE